MPAFTVRQGRRYKAVISLGLLESFAGNDAIADRLAEAVSTPSASTAREQRATRKRTGRMRT